MGIKINVPVSILHTLAQDAKAGEKLTVTGTVEHEVPQADIDRHLGAQFAKFAAKATAAEEARDQAIKELEALKSGGSPEFAKKLQEAVTAKEAEIKTRYEAELKAEQAKVLKATELAKLSGKLLPAYAASITVEASDTEATIKAKVEAAMKQQDADLAAAGVTPKGTGFGGNGQKGADGSTEEKKLADLSRKFYKLDSGDDAHRAMLMKIRIDSNLFNLETGLPVKR